MKLKRLGFLIIGISLVFTIEASAYEAETLFSKLVDKFTYSYNFLDFNYGEKQYEDFEITAYDLSVQSCGKRKTHPEYGITYTGFDLQGKSISNEDYFIAVDPKVIPLGSYVKILFDKQEYMWYNDIIFKAVDTGRLIKGNKIDVFFGEDKNKEALDFGRVKAKAYVFTEEEVEKWSEFILTK